jgi:hypothetical protein
MRIYRRPTFYIVVTGLVLLFGVMAIRHEPTYEGKTVSEWVWQYAWANQQGFHEPPTVAMQHIGPRAVPLLVTELQRQNLDQDGHSRKFHMWLATPDWIHRLIRWREPADLGDAYKLREAAAMTLGSLGAQARPAIPALQSAVKDSTPHVRLQAAYALWEIDHAFAAQVVPLLMELHNDPHNFKYDTTLYLGRIGVDARVAIPLIRETLNDPNPNIAANAKAALKTLEAADKKAQKSND